jgi:16S rRNA (adenine(1408)-N(1))-methyltransferase
MPGIIIDIGTGDGEFVYKIAKENPDRFIIGIEPHHQGLERISARVYKKPAKGGINNALFVLSKIEEMPAELDGIANQVFINFPWAGLLKALLLADAAAWEPIKRICKNGAFIDILFGYEKYTEENEFKNLGLPAISVAYLKDKMAVKLADYGLRVLETKEIIREDIKNYPSSWAKKLGYGRDRQYFHVRLKRE